MEVEPKFEVIKTYNDYAAINIRMQSYDYAPLEVFQEYVERISTKMGFKVIESYPVAAQVTRATTLDNVTAQVDEDITFSYYDRVVRVEGVKTIHLPILALLLQAHAPIGTKITIKEHEKADEDFRYIPDWPLIAKERELALLDNPVYRKQIGWDRTGDELPNAPKGPPKK
uniref:Ribosomal protein S10 domain-containing protein n=2 Tax=Acrobeloides nanus TaxID=290746 RepID=A0A914CLI2_9BILA